MQDKRQPTAAELRAIESEKKAAFRQARMKALEEDALKAQAVIAQVKALSTSSLEGSVVSDSDKTADNSLFSWGSFCCYVEVAIILIEFPIVKHYRLLWESYGYSLTQWGLYQLPYLYKQTLPDV